ncbi:hypothetical protein [Parasynechococcus marenigrum]|uniref:Uncharacterized protein n=1 Tax=Parasynechococcus marenigrum (strain WH8102) TaxID=84588 RepID=Q7U433_PARMW|nr:hypothetical protein [Parasynechococcus marenigrum]CAE08757.1 conserved hypothetical protein [Parasynechococcus marenigrum WH 8102]
MTTSTTTKDRHITDEEFEDILESDTSQKLSMSIERQPSALSQSDIEPGLQETFNENWEASIISGLTPDQIRLLKERTYYANKYYWAAGKSIRETARYLAEIRENCQTGTWMALCESNKLNISSSKARELANVWDKWLKHDYTIPELALVDVSTRTLNFVANIKDEETKLKAVGLLRDGNKISEDKLKAILKEKKTATDEEKAKAKLKKELDEIEKDASLTDYSKLVKKSIKQSEFKLSQMPARIKKLQQENKELEEKLDALKEAAKGPEEAKAYIEKIRATAQAKREETSFARKG